MPVYYNSDSMKKWKMDARKDFNEKNKPIIISDDSDGNTNEFECKYCRRIIRSKFTEDSIWCQSCLSETIIDKDTKPIKKALKAEVADNYEVFVATTPEPTSPFDKQPVEYQGAFKTLSEKGIRITSYHEYLPGSGQTQRYDQGSSSSSNQNKGRRTPGPIRGEGGNNETD